MDTIVRRLTRVAGIVLVLVAASLPLGGQAAFASTGSVLADIVPGSTTGNGRGIAFDGANLWYTLEVDPHVYHVSTSGAFLGSITVGAPGSLAGPLAWDGSALWTVNYQAGASLLLRVDPSTGNVLTSCDFVAANPADPAVTTLGKGIGNFPDGLDWSGSALWLSGEGAVNAGNWVAELDPATCKDLMSFVAPPLGSDGASGVAFVGDPFNGDKLWQAHPDVPDIFQTDTGGVLTGLSFPAIHLTEDLAFDPTTFSPKCAVWANESILAAANHLTAYEIPCPERAITARGTTISATEGASFSGPVATFTDPDTTATASEYTATIAWGDGATTAGTISGGGGSFSVSGTHSYTEEGTYPITVTITDIDTPANTATAHSTAQVADAAIAATCAASAVSPMSFSGPVASLTDANPNGTVADFTATISWGDASSSAGTVSGPTGGPFTVSGTHSYSSTGPFTITAKIVDDGGSTATTTCAILVFGTSAGGNFVIGDGNKAVGSHVTFWGAQWAKRNTLSGGHAPAAFKGFETTPSGAPACGTSWSTLPGNSPPPSAGPLPAFMAVIVASSISKSGSTISGNTPHVVVVQTNPGYAPNPGHAGTGKVIAIVC
jgi:hypothetical protein